MTLAAPRDASPLTQAMKFGAVGLSNALFSLLTDALLQWVGCPALIAAGLAFLAGAANGYAVNRRWTFRAADNLPTRLRYLAVQIGGLGATVGLSSVLHDAVNLPSFRAYLLAAAPVTLAMFTANRQWTFAARV